MIPAMIGYSIDETTGFPNDYKFAQVKGAALSYLPHWNPMF